jgi:hypothetical protein
MSKAAIFSASHTTGGDRRGLGSSSGGGRRILTPKSYGWGYDINLRELARRLRLRP